MKTATRNHENTTVITLWIDNNGRFSNSRPDYSDADYVVTRTFISRGVEWTQEIERFPANLRSDQLDRARALAAIEAARAGVHVIEEIEKVKITHA